MKTWNMIIIALLTLLPITFAQIPIDAIAGSAQEQINAVGQQLQQNAVQHVLEGNITQEHISQELNATRQNLTEQAKEKLAQELDENLNLTSEQLQQKAAEELKRQVSQKAPGFEVMFALIGLLCMAAIGRKYQP